MTSKTASRRAADAVAAKVLADVVLPALTKLRDAHENVATARVTLRSANADLARARAEPPDFMYFPDGPDVRRGARARRRGRHRSARRAPARQHE